MVAPLTGKELALVSEGNLSRFEVLHHAASVAMVENYTHQRVCTRIFKAPRDLRIGRNTVVKSFCIQLEPALTVINES